MAKSYVKIYGPPVLKSLKALEKVALEMSKKTTMRYFSALVPGIAGIDEYGRTSGFMYTGGVDTLERYTTGLLTEAGLTPEEKIKLISRSGETLGEYDFFFEWGTDPSKAQVEELIGLVDDALADCGCRYTIVTK